MDTESNTNATDNSDAGEAIEVRPDPMVEVTAMSSVAAALSPLSKDGARRVLTWASDHFGLGEISVAAQRSVQEPSKNQDVIGSSAEDIQEESDEFDDIADLFSAVDTRSGFGAGTSSCILVSIFGWCE